jgi:hypothetical protein
VSLQRKILAGEAKLIRMVAHLHIVRCLQVLETRRQQVGWQRAGRYKTGTRQAAARPAAATVAVKLYAGVAAAAVATTACLAGTNM